MCTNTATDGDVPAAVDVDPRKCIKLDWDDDIATGIEAWLTAPNQFPFAPDNARRFAAENTAEHFAATLLQHVCTPVLNVVS